MKQKKQKVPLRYRSKTIGIVLCALVNILTIALIIFVGKYRAIQGEIFSVVLLSLCGFTLIMNVIVLLGYVKNLLIFRKAFFWIATLFLLLGALGGYYGVRAEQLLGQIFNPVHVEKVPVSLRSIYDEPQSSMLDVGYLTHDIFGFGHFAEVAIKEGFGFEDRVGVVAYDTLGDMIEDMESGLIDGMIAADADITQEAQSIKVLKTHTFTSQQSARKGKIVDEPFTILMTGLNDNLSDSIIIGTFNPERGSITMTSVSRDSYVPIACYSGWKKDKLNHSRGRGRQCLVDTLEAYLDIDIDYYFEADFYAVVKIVDALGGLDIESPVAFAGSFPVEGEKDVFEPIHVPKGLNHLNGKQVLTFARERDHMPNGDPQRQQNQQMVIKKIVESLIASRNPQTFINVLNGAKDNFSSNLSIHDLTQLMGYVLNQDQGLESLRVSQSQIVGDSGFVGDMWIFDPYMDMLEDNKSLIKTNLGELSKQEGQQTLAFDVTNPYHPMSAFDVSKYMYTSPLLSEFVFVPPFAGHSTVNDVKTWAQRMWFDVRYDTVEGKVSGLVTAQSVEPGYYRKGTIDIFEVESVKETQSVNHDTYLPNFKDMSIEEAKSWARLHRKAIRVTFLEIEDPGITRSSITYQNIPAETPIEGIEGSTVTVTVAHPVSKEP